MQDEAAAVLALYNIGQYPGVGGTEESDRISHIGLGRQRRGKCVMATGHVIGIMLSKQMDDGYSI